MRRRDVEHIDHLPDGDQLHVPLRWDEEPPPREGWLMFFRSVDFDDLVTAQVAVYKRLGQVVSARKELHMTWPSKASLLTHLRDDHPEIAHERLSFRDLSDAHETLHRLDPPARSNNGDVPETGPVFGVLHRASGSSTIYWGPFANLREGYAWARRHNVPCGFIPMTDPESNPETWWSQ